MPTDPRIVYGARCTWWDSIDKVGHIPTGASRGLPCCPNCRSVLFECPNEGEWFTGIDRYEADGHPGYRNRMTWARGRCFPDMKTLDAIYVAVKTEPHND